MFDRYNTWKIRMSTHPLNLAVRFLLELTGLIAWGMWGYSRSGSWTGIAMMILLPAVFAAVWGIFAVRGDPSRSGKTVVPTPGPVRLLIELALFALAAWMLADLKYTAFAWIFGMASLGHYAFSYDRIRWLLKTRA